MEQEEKEMTPEEMKAHFEARKAEWEAFVKDLKDNPEKTVTNAELWTTIDFVTENINNLAQMLAMIMHNMDVLNHNFQSITMALGLGKPGMVGRKTQSGIILP